MTGLDDASVNSPATRPTLRRLARAKLNLALSVGPPDPSRNNYHPIASWMTRVDLADDLLVTRLDDDRLSRYAILWHADAPVRSPIDWSITRDLAVRAHLLVEAHEGRSLPVQLKLEKRIPVGGGLGGASADAAAMLLAVNELWDLDLSIETLTGLAMELGSDVAYCLGSAPALVGGLGERVEPMLPVRADLVLILPDFGCETARVYSAFDRLGPGPLRENDVRELASSSVVDPAALFNDLALPAERMAPRLGRIIEGARDVADGLPVHITGSGSTCFVVCPGGANQARMLASDIEAELGDVRTIATSIV